MNFKESCEGCGYIRLECRCLTIQDIEAEAKKIKEILGLDTKIKKGEIFVEKL